MSATTGSFLIAVLSLIVACIAGVISHRAQQHAKTSAEEATRANDLEVARRRAERRPEVALELTGGPVRTELHVHNNGTSTLDSLTVRIVGPAERLRGSGFAPPPEPGLPERSDATTPERAFRNLEPAVEQTADFWVLVEPYMEHLSFVCLARQGDDEWSFRIEAKPPYDISSSIY